ncbi:hypothetical protein FS749_010344 [Ceratobasidium sp. UAMH 11750]|nr:hypothetical protein FS749_010344 [Ceratobasidium sp. UAMH 11750]
MDKGAAGAVQRVIRHKTLSKQQEQMRLKQDIYIKALIGKLILGRDNGEPKAIWDTVLLILKLQVNLRELRCAEWMQAD